MKAIQQKQTGPQATKVKQKASLIGLLFSISKSGVLEVGGLDDSCPMFYLSFLKISWGSEKLCILSSTMHIPDSQTIHTLNKIIHKRASTYFPVCQLNAFCLVPCFINNGPNNLTGWFSLPAEFVDLWNWLVVWDLETEIFLLSSAWQHRLRISSLVKMCDLVISCSDKS